MNQKPTGRASSSEQIIRDIKRKTRRQYGAEEKIRIVLDGLRGKDSIAELCRREGIAQSLYYKWSKDFMEAGKKRLAGDIVRQANTSEVAELRREARDLKEVVAEQTLELRPAVRAGFRQFLLTDLRATWKSATSTLRNPAQPPAFARSTNLASA